MPTSLKLSSLQIAELRALRAAADNRAPDAVGAWADFYHYLTRVIRDSVLPYSAGLPVSAFDVSLIRGQGILGVAELDSLVWLMAACRSMRRRERSRQLFGNTTRIKANCVGIFSAIPNCSTRPTRSLRG